MAAKITLLSLYLSKTPKILQKLFPSMIWKGPIIPGKKTVYLTFDDGPVPEVTPWVLDILRKYNTKATFFCVGENIQKYPDLFQGLKDQGHSIGNHTYHHLSGYKTTVKDYLQNINLASSYINSPLFRPPYGRITKAQRNAIQHDYSIIMWEVLSGDFDPSIDSKKCYQNVLSNVEDGSIVVFHDSIKAFPRLEGMLENCIEALLEKGFSLEKIPISL